MFGTKNIYSFPNSNFLFVSTRADIVQLYVGQFFCGKTIPYLTVAYEMWFNNEYLKNVSSITFLNVETHPSVHYWPEVNYFSRIIFSKNLSP